MSEEHEDDISLSDIEQETKYKGELHYELILGRQINRIAIFREVNIKQYASAIDTLIIMLPKDLRRTAKQKREKLDLKIVDYNGINDEKQGKYDELWETVNVSLDDRGLFFKTASFKRGA